jgi:beta-lactamase regulating signal transducer with metallopeptidase domain
MNLLIETLNAWAEHALRFAWPMLWQSSLLIGLLFVLDLLMRRKVRPAVRYSLWLVVLVKLVLPPSLAVPTSPGWWLRQARTVPAEPRRTTVVVTYGPSESPVFPVAATPVFVAPPRPHLSPAAWVFVGVVVVGIGLLAWMLRGWHQVTRDARRAAAAPESLSELFHELRGPAELSRVFTLGAHGNETQRREERGEKSGEDGAQTDHLSGAHLHVSETGMPLRPSRLGGLMGRSSTARLRLRLTDHPHSPAVCGLIRPVVLLPRSLAEHLPPAQLRAVLLHELLHLRRGDVWVNCAQALLQIAYWWHPLLWFANARIRRVREEAVDDAVMLALNEDAEAYAPTLLEVAKLALPRPLASLGLVGILESRSSLRQRIERLMDFHPPRRAGLTLASAMGVLGFAALAVPMGEAPAPTSPEEATTTRIVTNHLAPGASSTAGSPSGSATDVRLLVQDGKLLYEMGKLDDAEAKLERALTEDPDNQTAFYYLKFVREARTNIIPERKALLESLKSIHLEHVSYVNLPLGEVLRSLAEEARTHDPKKLGVNFFIWPEQRWTVSTAGAPEPQAHLGAQETNAAPLDLHSLPITINPALTNVSLLDVVEAIVKASNLPIKYSIQNYEVMFALVTLPKSPPLYVRTFKVDQNTLIEGLHMANGPMATNQIDAVSTVLWDDHVAEAGVDLDPLSNPGKALFYNNRHGMKLVRATNQIDAVLPVLREHLAAAGVDLDPIRNPEKALFYNGRQGMLLVRATLEDLDIITREITALANPAVAASVSNAALPSRGSAPGPAAFTFMNSTNTTSLDQKLKVATLVQDGKLLYEMGKLDEAEAKLKLALKEDPNNQTVLYYLNLVSKSKFDRALHPGPNPIAQTNPAYAGKGRQAIITKLDRIRLDRVFFDSLPLREVVRSLADEARKRDPEKSGINFLLNQVVDSGFSARAEVLGPDGNPLPAAPPEQVDMGAVTIKINPPLTDIRLADVLDAIVKAADRPIKYSIQDYAVVFSARAAGETPPLYMRAFKVDPNIFLDRLRATTGLTLTNRQAAIGPALHDFLAKSGVEMEPPKSIFYDDRRGMLLIRATLQDLDLIEAAIPILNIVPPQVNIKVKFVEVPQDDTKALGFDWYLGNVMMTNGAVGGQAGATTSNTNSPLFMNPMGNFPGNPSGPASTNIAPSSTNGLLTFGLRNSSTSPSTINGILTGPQYRAVIQSLQQRSGTELLGQPEATTLSGRQVQMKMVDIKAEVKGVNQQALTPPGITTTNEDESALYVSEPMELGPVLDVIPTVLPDGYTIALTVIPTVTEFLGYQEGQTNRVAVYVNGKKKWVIPPEPIVRQQQMSTSLRVWDGQTVVLGGLTSEKVNILKDKVPLLGDLPLVGRLFRSESKATTKKNLLIFITPTLIDPAGNRVHTADEVPSARNTVPPQPAR